MSGASSKGVAGANRSVVFQLPLNHNELVTEDKPSFAMVSTGASPFVRALSALSCWMLIWVSLLCQAIANTLNQWEKLTAFLYDGLRPPFGAKASAAIFKTIRISFLKDLKKLNKYRDSKGAVCAAPFLSLHGKKPPKAPFRQYIISVQIL
jgi:hypothetical protein